jgi:site-specific recombinase XerD
MAHDHTTQVIPESILQAETAFLTVIRSRRRSKSTLEGYKRAIDLLRSYLEIQPILNITSDDLRAFFTELQADHNVGGVEFYFRPIRAMFNWFWDEYEIDKRNPISKVKVAHQPPNPQPGIPLNDFNAIYDACTLARDKAIIYGLLDTCARATEFCSFKIKDIDLTTGQAIISYGKGGKRRPVRFGNRSMRALRKYLKTRESLHGNDPLFATKSNEAFDRFSLRLLIDRRADDAGVPHYGIHAFRRRGAYEMWKVTRDLKGVSLYLGHSDVSVTKRYINVEDDDILETHINGGAVDNL